MESAAVTHTYNITVFSIHISLSLSLKYLPIKRIVKQQNPKFGKIIPFLVDDVGIWPTSQES